MAELLIYKKAHWMDALTQAQIDERVKQNATFQAKYDSRLQKGDILGAYPDGHWIGRMGWDTVAFSVVKIALSENQAKAYSGMLDEPSFDVVWDGKQFVSLPSRKILKRAKYNIGTTFTDEQTILANTITEKTE